MTTIALAILLGVAPKSAAPSCVTADERVEAAIRAKAKELKGEENCQFRIYEAMSDVDGDKADDFLVVFSIEGTGGGGNNHQQFLAVFSSTLAWRPVLTQVGARGERNVTSVEVVDGRIRLGAMTYAESDPACCPSKPGTVSLKWSDGKLVNDPS
jgi:hypothetical protein